MKFFEEQARERAKQVDAAWSEYRALVRKIAADDKLTKAEAARFDALLGVLGFTVAEAKGHAAAVRRVAELEPVAADRQRHAASIKDIEAEAAAFRAEEDKALADLARRAQGISARLADANAAVARCDRAADDAQAVRVEHWQLFGLPDPAATSATRRVARVLFAGDEAKASDAFAFEGIMQNPKGFANVFGPGAPAFTFAPVDGQTAADLAALVSLARTLVMNGKSARYLVPAALSEKAVSNRQVIIVADPILAGRDYIDPDEFTWLPFPGQTQAELDALLAKCVRKSMATHPAAMYGEGERSRASYSKWLQPE